MSAEAPQPTQIQQPAPLAPRPFGILMLAGFQLLIGVGALLAALLIAVPALFARDQFGPFAGLADALVVFSLLGVVVSAFVVVLAIGLLRRWRWAHRATIALFILELLAAAAALIVSQGQQVGFFGLALNVFFVYYLVTPKVYAYFGTA